MPDAKQFTLVDADSTTGAKSSFDVRNLTAMSVFSKAVGGTSAVFTLEGTADPAATLGWATLATREAGGGTYATTATTTAAGTGDSVYLDPTDNIAHLRVNVSANTGPTALTVYLNAEY